jgi:hypothetical protein
MLSSESVRTSEQLPAVDTLRAMVEAEYREMPGLSLTIAQACRLWAIDSCRCMRVLTALTQSGFLRLDDDGHYRRASDADVSSWRLHAD